MSNFHSENWHVLLARSLYSTWSLLSTKRAIDSSQNRRVLSLCLAHSNDSWFWPILYVHTTGKPLISSNDFYADYVARACDYCVFKSSQMSEQTERYDTGGSTEIYNPFTKIATHILTNTWPVGFLLLPQSFSSTRKCRLFPILQLLLGGGLVLDNKTNTDPPPPPKRSQQLRVIITIMNYNFTPFEAPSHCVIEDLTTNQFLWNATRTTVHTTQFNYDSYTNWSILPKFICQVGCDHRHLTFIEF